MLRGRWRRRTSRSCGGDRLLGVGEDRVLHLYRIVGQGAGSGVPVSRHNAILWELRSGKLLKGQMYPRTTSLSFVRYH
jgi:hypothetical protein